MVRRPSRPLLAVGLLLILAACGYGAWSWHQLLRPGRVYYDRGMDDAAAHHFHQAEHAWLLGVREDPSFPGNDERLGDLYEKVHDYPDATKYDLAATKLDPNNGPLFRNLCRVDMLQEDERGALFAAKRAYELMPQDAGVAADYGLLASRATDETDAYAALERACRLAPTVRPYKMQLLSVEADMQQWPALQRDASAYLKNFPDDPWANYMMAVVYNHEPRTPSNLHAAIAYAERSIAAGQSPPQVYPLLGQLYLDSGRPQDALRVCQTALRVAPHNQEVLYELIGCFSRLGQPKLAAQVSATLKPLAQRVDRIAYLEQVMRFNNADVKHGLELARLVEQEGKVKTAQQFYAALLSEVPHNAQVEAAYAAFLKRTGANRTASPPVSLGPQPPTTH